MADVRAALAPLGPWMRSLLVMALIEVLLLFGELVLTHVIGQRAIAAAMITAPRSEAAWLGAVAVLLRIASHAIFPAFAAFLLAQRAVRRMFS